MTDVRVVRPGAHAITGILHVMNERECARLGLAPPLADAVAGAGPAPPLYAIFTAPARLFTASFRLPA